MKLVVAALAGLGLFITQDAFAQGKTKGRVITISEVTIVGRVLKPIASVDVNKIPPKLTLSELKQAFVDRIEAATKKDPF